MILSGVKFTKLLLNHIKNTIYFCNVVNIIGGEKPESGLENSPGAKTITFCAADPD